MVWTLLVAAWAVVLVPAFMRHRAERGGDHSIVAFRQRLSSIHTARDPIYSGSLGRSPFAPPSQARRARKRRRDILTGLLVSAVLSLGLSLLPGLSVLLILHLVLDGLLGVYVLLLLRWRHGTLSPRTTRPEFDEPADLRLAYTDDAYGYAYSRSSASRR